MIEDYDNVDYEYFKEWDIEQYKRELKRLNNIINKLNIKINNMHDIIRQQPSEDSDTDEWIINRLNGLLHIIKGSDKE